eukprot:CAMPEP_0182494804 /NCGR_PEP_ID=MMETSP1321-20130603/3643_1 /TAXON_ID=91990 /ORGANISM="Bolidomonas sp., Strain RCC1657" /LENGTH=264 /DNA_ID=CAMNT_0024697995 /DNA_START=72 /DNA_END=866 /DNA_ORIENTATION=+
MKLLALLMLLPTAASFTINQLNHHLNPGRAPGLSPTRTNRLSRVPKLNAGGGAAAGVEQYDGVRIGPPPDLPSLLLHNRIVYIGMPLVPAVTELIIAELLYLNYESSDKPIYMYINSSGTLSQDGRPVGFETEAFAIADCIRYIKPPVHTIALGQAQGAAAMLLGMGKKGFRYALPNAVITLTQPKGQARGQASDIAIRAKEVMANKKVTCDLIAKATGKSIEEVEKDCQRVKYFDGEEAKDYGLVDKVLHSTKDLPVEPSFLS